MPYFFNINLLNAGSSAAFKAGVYNVGRGGLAFCVYLLAAGGG
jgi:hypothetical protein